MYISVSVDEKARREKYQAELAHKTDHRGYRFWFVETFSSERSSRTNQNTEVGYCLQMAGFKKIPKIIGSSWEKLSMIYPPVSTESGPKLVQHFLEHKMAVMKTPLGSISERGVRRMIRTINQVEATRTMLAFG